MRFSKNTIRLVCVLLVGLLLQSCYSYKAVPVNQNSTRDFKGRYLKLIWETTEKRDMMMTNVAVNDSSITGQIVDATDLMKSLSNGQIVNLYVSAKTPTPPSLPADFSIPIKDITRIEVYDFDIGKLVLGVAVVGAGIALAYGLLLLIILLTKESCPFVYVYNGETFEFTGEIFSGAIYPGLERHDWLPLPNLKPLGNEYQLKLANQVKEIQHTNLAELLVIDHPLGTSLLVDRYGKYQILKKPSLPKLARTQQDKDILPLIASRDSLKYLGDAFADPQQSKDTMYLSFDRPVNTSSAKLVLRAKNSFWLDYTFGQFFEQFGDKYKVWYEKQKKLSPEQQGTWSLEQGIPLSVSMKVDGKWQFVDYFNVIGPVAEKDVVMPIDISKLDSDTIELKLDYGFLFWEIDYAGLDFAPQEYAYQQVVPLISAKDQDGRDVTSQLTKDDKDYFTMERVGNEALLRYAMPAPRENYARSVFLHSKGHYEVIRDPKGNPDLAYLKSFREPGRFGEFSKEIYLEMLKKNGK